MIKVITTVGVSVFSNGIKAEKIDKKRIDTLSCQGLTYYSCKDDEYYHREIETLENETREYFKKSNYSDSASAEIKSLVKIQEQVGEKVEVHLICTDTILSPVASKMIIEWFDQYSDKDKFVLMFDHTENYIVKGLQIDNPEKFEQEGIDSLFKILERYTKEKASVLNISGGYKAIIPVLTIIGQLYQLPIYYTYEESNALITINPLPINFDWNVGELYADYLLDKEVCEQLEEESELLRLLRDDYKLIKKDSRETTLIGTLLAKYIDNKMLVGDTFFGHVAEYMIYEGFILKPYPDYTRIPILGKKYGWNKLDKEVWSLGSSNKEDEEEIEVDLILSDETNNQIWCEIKAYSKKGLQKALNQIKKRMEFNEMALKVSLKEIFLIVYKFDFQTITKNQQLDNIIKICSEKNIKFKLWYFDIPVHVEQQKSAYTQLFEQKVQLELFNLSA